MSNIVARFHVIARSHRGFRAASVQASELAGRAPVGVEPNVERNAVNPRGP